MAPQTTLDRLRSEIAQGKALAIIGSGVSIAATRKAPTASWTGLLKHGVDFCVANGQTADWAGRVRAEIDSGDLTTSRPRPRRLSRQP